MKQFFSFLSRNQAAIYRVFLFLLSTFLVIYLLPKGGQFKYNFQKGKPWQYENLYAPFSFAIKKSEAELTQEKKNIRENTIPYFEYRLNAKDKAKAQFDELLKTSFVDSLFEVKRRTIETIGYQFIDQVYRFGVIDEVATTSQEDLIYLKRGNEVEEITFGPDVSADDMVEIISKKLH